MLKLGGNRAVDEKLNQAKAFARGPGLGAKPGRNSPESANAKGVVFSILGDDMTFTTFTEICH
jgi:hypothetical protein